MTKLGVHRFKWYKIPLYILLAVLIIISLVFLFRPKSKLRGLTELEMPDWVDVQIISILGKGRRGEKLEELNGIVIHYVGNPGTTAQQNHDYFAQRTTTVSSHFLIGLDGEIIQCIPLDEKSSASNHRNRDTISIEVCHPDADGKFTDASYQSLVRLCAWLCENTGLKADDIIRHYDVTGKKCPLYYVDHPDDWDKFISDVKTYLENK